MDIIHVLDKQISDLIAAGEVVERPSSVVKELVENSIDAGATKIKIEIEKGGTTLIRVTDNGKGMTENDAENAFLKHATSKLHQKSDLYSIQTLGFRGEALCAISAVSEITLKTKTADTVEGTCVKMTYGTLSEKKQIAYVTGTSITVENLFANTPARLKFLKSEAAETSAISSLITTLALANPNIAFSYSVNSKEKLFTYGKGDLKDAVFCIEGKEFADNIIPVSVSAPYGTDGKRIAVNGFIGKPLYTRPSRSKQLFYINNRMIRSRIMQSALENGYRSYIMSGRFPVCILNLTIPYDEVDINVHPGKLEAKFGDERAVYDVILAAVTLGLNKDRATAPEMRISTPKSQTVSYTQPTIIPKTVINVEKKKEDTPAVTNRQAEVEKLLDGLEKRADEVSVKKYEDWTIFPANKQVEQKPAKSVSISASGFDNSLVFSDIKKENEPVVYKNLIITPPEETKKEEVPVKEEEVQPVVAETIEKQEPEIIKLTEEFSVAYKYIGECFNTYILLEGENELYVIDKHALHERMNFEKLKKERVHESQTLLTPLIITVEADKLNPIVSRKEFLYSIGFDIDEFGDDAIAIRAIPNILNQAQAESVLCNFAETLTDSKAFVDAELMDEFLYDIACKASIRAGAESSETELRALADEYMKNRDTLSYCPHGRPVMITLTKNSIEKNFKRLV